MIEIKVEDVLIPLLNNHYDEVNFNEIFDATTKNPKPLYLKDDFGFSEIVGKVPEKSLN